jgi:prepilin-type N-terminal cleavage/methylation domain-containing protein
MTRSSHYRSGFTLVEILMVVVILAVLAAVIIPRFTGYADRGAESTTKANLQTLRSGLQAYYVTHNNSWPASTLASLLTTNGGTMDVLPKEAILNLNKIVNTADGTGGWHYDTTSHSIAPNLTGNDSTGVAFSAY